MDTLTRTAITLPLTPALTAGMAATLAHASRDKVTPVIATVQVTRRHFVATDRYTVGQYEHTTLAESVERHGEEGPADPDAAILLPMDAADWLAKHKPTGRQTVTLTPDSVAIHWENDADGAPIASRSFAPIVGNYPPVARLIPERTDAPQEILPTSLGVDSLTKLAKSATALGRADRTKNIPVRFQFAGSDGYKSAPVMATVGERFVSLIQPILVRP